ncbi:MAG: Peptidase protein [Patescibacteria group bacterium]|nr:Peptidase protein [Patescibacteria group bacterium]
MQSSKRKWIIIAGVSLVLIVASIFIFSPSKKEKEIPANLIDSTPEVIKEVVGPKIKSIGTSVQGRKIESYTYGSGATHIAFVGGVHGGYEWNTILLAYKFIDYLNANPSIVPSYLTVSIVPNANPDGMFKVVGKEGRFLATEIPKDDKLQASGRFNANNVDLNRNFDCEWKPESTWRGNVVSAGASVFSEPEAKVLRDFVQANKFKSVIFWHSQSGIVYGSDCENGILPETVNIMNTYAKAAGYGAVEKFNAYKVTGDSEGWLAKIGIPAITVELTNHESIEWEKNLAGMKALFTYYTPK